MDNAKVTQATVGGHTLSKFFHLVITILNKLHFNIIQLQQENWTIVSNIIISVIKYDK